jgi:hypothetical protein
LKDSHNYTSDSLILEFGPRLGIIVTSAKLGATTNGAKDA